MLSQARTLLNAALRPFDIAVTRHSHLTELESRASASHDLLLLATLPSEHAPLLLKHLGSSRSQIRQDLFVLAELEFKRDGYFVEFGATNGIDLSNTHLLEKEFGWTGILAEPARCWHGTLRQNRSALIETSCVWKDSGTRLSFNEVAFPELSTIDRYSDSDVHSSARKKGRTYDVETVSLNDLLDRYSAPEVIDYLSIDTEGSEYEILSHFDFRRRRFRVITCEHNFTPRREDIFRLLTSMGYERKFESLSKVDDWYVLSRS